MYEEQSSQPSRYRSGGIVVDPVAKRLTREGRAVPIGGRCFDLLMCLLERPGEVLSRDMIVERVWPGIFVSDGNLRVQILQLRKILDPGAVVNVPGRGYVFAAPVERVALSGSDGSEGAERDDGGRLIGRASEVRSVADLLRTSRLVTIVGSGGVGKSSLAETVSERFVHHAVTRIDLSPATDGHSIVTSMIRSLGSNANASMVVLGTDIAYDDSRDRLMIFDSCEHLPDIAEAISELLAQTERLRVLCTSREPVRVAGEQLFRLATLAVPPATAVSAPQVLEYHSVQLFLRRARSVVPEFDLTDDNAPLLAELSRRLDGIPLAIELAAGRLNALGLKLLTDRLNGYDALAISRTASGAPRHRTLAATLDWSYGLLSNKEQAGLCWLSLLAGEFTIEAAEFMLQSDADDAVDRLISLIDKSLVSVDLTGRRPLYRLLDTTKSFARDRLLRTPADASAAKRRHANYVAEALKNVQSDLHARSEDDWLDEYGSHLDDIRAALDWSFSPDGDPGIGLAITALAPALWFRMSLVAEAKRRIEEAMAQLERNPSEDLQRDFEVYAAMGASLNYTIGPGDETRKSWDQALAIARRLDRDDLRMRAYWGIWLRNFSGRHMRESLAWAKDLSELAERTGEPADRITGHRLQAMTLTWLGEVDEASRHLDAIAALGDPGRSTLVAVHFDHVLISDAARSVAWWIQGAQDRAVSLSGSMIERASRSRHHMSLALALVDCGCLVTFLSDERPLLVEFVDKLRNVARQQASGPWEGWSRSYEGCLLALEGKPGEAIEPLQIGLRGASKARWMVLRGIFMAKLAECLIAVGEIGAALHVLDQGISDSQLTGELWALPELLRIKAAAFFAIDDTSDEGESHLRQSLDFAAKWNHRSWRLRSGADLAARLARNNQITSATSLLREVMSDVSEGRHRPDWRRADAILNSLSGGA